MVALRAVKSICMLGIFGLGVCGLGALSAQATVVVRQVDTVAKGWSGNLSAAFEESVATTEKFGYDASFSVVHKNHNNEWRGFGSFAYGEVNEVKNEDAQMLHLRHIRHHAFGDWRWESFAQTGVDDFASLGHRHLLGAGPSRLLQLNNGWRVLALLGVMREIEDHSQDSAQNRRETRLSGSLQGKYTSPYGWTLDAVSYWQPNIKGDIDDRRVTGELALSFPLSKNLIFTTRYTYRFNGVPFEGVPRENRKVASGLNYKF